MKMREKRKKERKTERKKEIYKTISLRNKGGKYGFAPIQPTEVFNLRIVEKKNNNKTTTTTTTKKKKTDKLHGPTILAYMPKFR